MNANWWAAGLVACAVQVLLCAPGAAGEARTYTETFDGAVPEVMLNGTIRVGPSGAWSTDLSAGSLVLVNATAPDAVRYIAIPWLVLEGSNMPERTDGADISAILIARGQGRTGAGIMAGPDARSGDYLLFGVGENGLYTVLRKAQRKVTVLATGTDGAIRSAQPNELRLERSENGFTFRVNEHVILEVPDQGLKAAPVGIAAFGIGRFEFDEVKVTIPATEAPENPQQLRR